MKEIIHKRVSVIMPTYNGGEYLKEQMCSLRDQTRKPDEVLIIDDCSTDNTMKIAEEFIKENGLENWTVTRNSETLGWRKNFWFGLLKASGDILFPCDQDDIWHREKINVLSRVLEEYEKISVVSCQWRVFENENELADISRCSVYEKDRISPVELHRNSFWAFSHAGCCECIRKEFMDRIKEYWNEEIIYDLFVFQTSVIDSSLYLYKDVFVYHRIHGTNVTPFGKARRNYDFVEETVKETVQHLEVLAKYAEDYKLPENKRNKVSRALIWSRLRSGFYFNRDYINGIKLVAYLDCFNRYKDYADDWKNIILHAFRLI